MHDSSGEWVIEVLKVGAAGAEKVECSKVTIGFCTEGGGRFCSGMTGNERGHGSA